jgi:hypothetical protein
MRKQYRQAIEKVFSSELLKVDPQFEKLAVKALCKYDGETAFAKKTEKATLFISLIPDPKGGEEFSVEIGWSTLHRFPELSMRPNVISATDRTEYNKAEGMLRLTSFSRKPSFGWKFSGVVSQFESKYFSIPDVMKSTPKEVIEQDLKRIPTQNEAIETIKNAVDEAMAELKENGFRYLEEYLSSVQPSAQTVTGR